MRQCSLRPRSLIWPALYQGGAGLAALFGFGTMAFIRNLVLGLGRMPLAEVQEDRPTAFGTSLAVTRGIVCSQVQRGGRRAGDQEFRRKCSALPGIARVAETRMDTWELLKPVPGRSDEQVSVNLVLPLALRRLENAPLGAHFTVRWRTVRGRWVIRSATSGASVLPAAACRSRS